MSTCFGLAKRFRQTCGALGMLLMPFQLAVAAELDVRGLTVDSPLDCRLLEDLTPPIYRDLNKKLNLKGSTCEDFIYSFTTRISYLDGEANVKFILGAQEGRLVKSIEVFNFDHQQALVSLIKKYGKPRIETYRVQNGMGARATQTVHYWIAGGKRLELYLFGDTIGSGPVLELTGRVSRADAEKKSRPSPNI